MLLAIDIGNTQTVVGVYKKDKLIHHWRFETKKERTADEWAVYLKELFRFEKLELTAIKGAVVSNVVPPMQRALVTLCEKYIHCTPLVVGPQIKIDMPIETDNPGEVGADRIVNAVAAFHHYKTNLIVVDFGTATTLDYISAEGEYQGGIIVPGVGISAEALFSRAAQLPRVELAKPKHVIGKNTVDCIQSGLYYGYSGMVDALVEKIQGELEEKATVIATGGYALLLAAESKTISHVHEFLTLEGLKLIYDWNHAG